MQDELERRQEECVQLRTVLANMDGQTSMSSFMSRIGELPEAEEIFTAYETQKNVIGQLREQVSAKTSPSDYKVQLNETTVGKRVSWFPTRVSWHTKVPWGGARGAAKYWKNILLYLITTFLLLC